MATLIATNGARSTVTPANPKTGFTLAELYRVLDCDTVETLSLRNGLTMVMDENGKYTTKDRNEEATVLARRAGIAPSDWVVGPVLIVNRKELQ